MSQFNEFLVKNYNHVTAPVIIRPSISLVIFRNWQKKIRGTMSRSIQRISGHLTLFVAYSMEHPAGKRRIY